MRLSSLQSSQGMYGLVGFNPLATLKDYWQLGNDLPESVQMQFLKPALAQTVSMAGEIATGLLLDPLVALSATSSTQAGLTLPLSIQRTPEIDPLSLPKIDSSWGVVEVKNNFGVAYLTLYYHPEEEKALQKKQLVAELADYCQYEKIDFILDLVLYTPAGEQFQLERFQEAQITAIQELRFAPQAMILQYPLDPLACATLTTELDVPWLVSSRGLRYEEFKETLRTSLEGGAKGFYLHELAWPNLQVNHEELVTASEKRDTQAIKELASQWHENFTRELTTHNRDQLIELMRITNEFGEAERQDV
jgi:tagatose-1,6-bisphosphate aldolase